MRRATGSAYLALVFALGLYGQVMPKRPSFEVGSVKENTTDLVTDAAPHRSGDRIRMHNSNLYMLIVYAYNIPNYLYQLPNDPDRLFSDTRFDIDAVAAGTAGDADLRPMFQTLLGGQVQAQSSLGDTGTGRL